MYINGVSRPGAHVAVELGEYLPLTVQLGKPGPAELYLRYVSDYSLLELGVSSTDGVLTSLKLVQVAGLSTAGAPSHPLIVEEGLPQFDTSCWKGKRLLDIESPVELILTESSAFLIFDRHQNAKKLLRNDSLTFAVSGGYPCWALLENLDKEQILEIRSTTEQNAPGGYL